MGSPLGPLMANACICMLEEKLVDCGAIPLYYRRYGIVQNVTEVSRVGVSMYIRD